MLNKLKQLFSAQELLKGEFAIEREGLRVDGEGRLALSTHPEVFGDKMRNPYITTDFSESQVELITPVFEKAEEVYAFSEVLYNIVALEIGEEYIWPQSMPCIIPEDQEIPLASYGSSEVGEDARQYREKLLRKYGGKKQLISGIHYNFSFKEEMIEKLYAGSDRSVPYQTFKDELYLKVTRNYLRYRWLVIYLLGGTAIMHQTYTEECTKRLQGLTEDSFSNDGALSYRNGECGYGNKVDLFANYDSVKGYVESLNTFIRDGVIENHKEFYSPIRLKAKDNHNLLSSLEEQGIKYLEYRSIDINPFSKGGISLEDLKFLQLFNLFLLIEEEETYDKWQEEALDNQRFIAKYGQKSIRLKRKGQLVFKEEWALEILESISQINQTLGLGQEQTIQLVKDRVQNHELTYAYQIVKRVKEMGYVQAHLSLAKDYKESAYTNRYKLEGYEDLELSTQILMKEAIKRGIKVEIIDRSEHFISLKQDQHTEYVKQATKTSKDDYVTVLMMENKVVTKRILDKAGIRVPKGKAFDTLEEAQRDCIEFANIPVVIKPKSTNFGKGISIFPQGASLQDMIKAFEIAFKHDETVLIEEFVPGKEYRFLIVDNQVVGILHRVPANVVGDGMQSIKELVQIKNQDPLRGKGYKTPLEKIELDESAALFLKQKQHTFESIPQKGEVVYLRENSNISTGGDSIDYTEDIPDTFKQIAVESAKAIGARICGVDMMIEDYQDAESTYAIIELNFNPAIHIHCYPFQGKERNIGEKILNLLGFTIK